jgi:mannose-6-phosphate isomerase
MKLTSWKLWMGTHPKSPSVIPVSRETLASYLAKNQSLIGETVSHKFGAEDGNLPFLFKVLAIEKALSIQSHPDKVTAEKLHAQQPDIYKGKLWSAASAL